MRWQDHPFAERLRAVPAKEVATWVIDDRAIETVSKEERTKCFKRIGKDIMATDRERRKYDFSVDTGGAIARALAWAFKAGMAAAELQRKHSHNSNK